MELVSLLINVPQKQNQNKSKHKQTKTKHKNVQNQMQFFNLTAAQCRPANVHQQPAERSTPGP